MLWLSLSGGSGSGSGSRIGRGLAESPGPVGLADAVKGLVRLFRSLNLVARPTVLALHLLASVSITVDVLAERAPESLVAGAEVRLVSFSGSLDLNAGPAVLALDLLAVMPRGGVQLAIDPVVVLMARAELGPIPGDEAGPAIHAVVHLALRVTTFDDHDGSPQTQQQQKTPAIHGDDVVSR